MAASDPVTPEKPAPRKYLLRGLGALVLVGLAAAFAAAGGVAGLIIMVGLGVLLLGAVAAVRGRARWAHVGNRRIGLMVALGGLGLLLVGGALAPTQSAPAASRAAIGSTATPVQTADNSLLRTTTPAESSVPPSATVSSSPPSTAVAPAVTRAYAPPPSGYMPSPRPQPPVAATPVVPTIAPVPPPQTSNVGAGSLGTAPIQKPPSGNFYRAGEFCPQVDAGKTTQDSSGRTLLCTNNNGLRWEYA